MVSTTRMSVLTIFLQRSQICAPAIAACTIISLSHIVGLSSSRTMAKCHFRQSSFFADLLLAARITNILCECKADLDDLRYFVFYY